MAKGPRYCVPFRRRREQRTDYKARRTLLLSGKPRLTPRGSIRNMIVQMIKAKPYGDEVMVSAHSRELAGKYGWKASKGNIPAAYLTGLLCGLRAKAMGVEEAVLDTGLHSPTKGARVFAALKGVLDAGVSVPHSSEKLPDEGKVRGRHIADYAESLGSEPEEYQARFSRSLAEKFSPKNLPDHFAEVKEKIATSVSGGAET